MDTPCPNEHTYQTGPLISCRRGACEMSSDLFFYEGSDGYAEFYKTSQGTAALQRQARSPQIGWTHIVQGQFVGAGLCQFLLYNSGSGTLQVWMVGTSSDGRGQSFLLNEFTNWRPGWTLLTAGIFAFVSELPGLTQLLCYDAAQGVGEFYYIGENAMSLAHRETGWRHSWNIIVPGNFGGDGVTDLLFYDADGGVGEFYAVDNSTLSLMKSFTDWRTTWKLIVPGNFGGNGFTDILLYDAGGGTGEFYSVNQGNISLLKTSTDWRETWDEIITGDFGGNSFDDLLFYDRAGGTGEFYTVNNGEISLLRPHTDWRTSWTKIMAGTYTGSSGVTTQPPMAYVSAAVEAFDPGSEFALLHIIGSSFKAGETVTLKITSQDGSSTPEMLSASTQANASGAIDYKYSGSGGGVCNPTNMPPRRFTVQGRGLTSHRESNVAVTGCR
jgi:hypothetical protein